MPSEAHPILLVARLPRNLQLLSEFLQKGGYTTVTAGSYDEFDLIIGKQKPISGALVDISGFNAEIWQRCEQLRAAKVPFLVVSHQQSAAVQKASLSHGARSVMTKPLVVKELIGIVQSLLAG